MLEELSLNKMNITVINEMPSMGKSAQQPDAVDHHGGYEGLVSKKQYISMHHELSNKPYIYKSI